MDNKQRDAIIERVRKLAKMTTQNGCSENEAASAAAKLAKLCAEFDVQQDEVMLKADAIGMIEDYFIVPRGSEGNTFTKYLYAVMKLFTVKVRMESGMDETLFDFPIECTKIIVYGYPLDVAAAIAMIQIVQVAMKFSIRSTYKDPTAKQKTAYQDGFAERIGERLDDIRREREFYAQSQPRTGALVVVKTDLVQKAYEEHKLKLGLNLSSIRYDGVTDRKAQVAGRVAANRVDLGGAAKVGMSGARIGHQK